MVLINEENKAIIYKNIDEAFNYFFNTEFAGPSGSFKIRMNANVVADIIKVKEFLDQENPVPNKAPSTIKGDK
jgi:hypothetical protein